MNVAICAPSSPIFVVAAYSYPDRPTKVDIEVHPIIAIRTICDREGVLTDLLLIHDALGSEPCTVGELMKFTGMKAVAVVNPSAADLAEAKKRAARRAIEAARKAGAA